MRGLDRSRSRFRSVVIRFAASNPWFDRSEFPIDGAELTPFAPRAGATWFAERIRSILHVTAEARDRVAHTFGRA